MKTKRYLLILLISCFFCMSCESKKTANEQNQEVRVAIETTMGNIVVKLYNETPLHRDNFVKLVKEGYYDGTLFHRVINQFMIQGGDCDSRNAKPGQQLGMGDPGYTIMHEIDPTKFYHKKGALAAARQGDEVNPNKKSSGSQFYIVTGRVFNDNELNQLEHQMNMQHEQNIFNSLAAQHRDEIMTMRRNRDQAGLQAMQEKLIEDTKYHINYFGKLRFYPEQREAYRTIGGAPHLDGGYTVFGEVVEGLDVVEKIEKVETDRADRPKEDVKVISMKVVE